MINDFLARLDNTPTPPGDWIWPSFTASIPGGAKLQWREALLGKNLAREHLFRRSLLLDQVVAISAVADYRTKQDTRLSYNQDDVNLRVGNYGWSVIASAGTAILTPTFFPKAPTFASTTLLATSSTTVLVTPAVGSAYLVTLSFSAGSSSSFNLLSDGSITAVLVGSSITTSQTWTFSYYSQHDDVVINALSAMRTLGEPLWLSPELLSKYRSFHKDLDKLACIICGLVQ